MRHRKSDYTGRDDVQLSDVTRAAPPANARPNAALKAAIALPASSSNLPTLRTLITNHRLLLSNIKRSNELLESDNTRMERELAIRQELVPPADACDGDGDGDGAISTDSAQAKLEWIENYIHGTLAQTLWALNARAAQLEERTTSADQQQQTHRLLQMTNAAYDQLRDLMTWLQGNVHD